MEYKFDANKAQMEQNLRDSAAKVADLESAVEAAQSQLISAKQTGDTRQIKEAENLLKTTRAALNNANKQYNSDRKALGK